MIIETTDWVVAYGVDSDNDHIIRVSGPDDFEYKRLFPKSVMISRTLDEMKAESLGFALMGYVTENSDASEVQNLIDAAQEGDKG